jgi:hypothetical protein
MRGGLVDDAGQCAKLLGSGGYSRVIQGICHLGFSVGWDFMEVTIGEARSICQQLECSETHVVVAKLTEWRDRAPSHKLGAEDCHQKYV